MIETNNTPVSSLDVNNTAGVDNTALSDELNPDNVNGTDYSSSHKRKAVSTITLLSATAISTGGLFTNSFLSAKPVLESSYRFLVYSDRVGYDFTISGNKNYQIYFEFYKDQDELVKKLNVSENKNYQSGKDAYPEMTDLNKGYRYRIHFYYTNGTDVNSDLLNFSFFTSKEDDGSLVYDKKTIEYLKRSSL